VDNQSWATGDIGLWTVDMGRGKSVSMLLNSLSFVKADHTYRQAVLTIVHFQETNS